MSQEQNRRAFFAIPRSVERFNKIAQAKTLDNTRVQPGTVRAMRFHFAFDSLFHIDYTARSVAEAMEQELKESTNE